MIAEITHRNKPYTVTIGGKLIGEKFCKGSQSFEKVFSCHGTTKILGENYGKGAQNLYSVVEYR